MYVLITYKANIVQKVPKDKGRERVRDKLMPFLENFKDIQNQLTDKLEENDIKEGSDVVVCKYVYVCMCVSMYVWYFTLTTCIFQSGCLYVLCLYKNIYVSFFSI